MKIVEFMFKGMFLELCSISFLCVPSDLMSNLGLYQESSIGICYNIIKLTYTHTRITALFRDYPGEPVPER